MEETFADNTSKSVAEELQAVASFAQRELIKQSVLPGPFDPDLAPEDLDELLARLLTEESIDDPRARHIAAAAVHVFRTFRSLAGVREQAIFYLAKMADAIEDGLLCLRSSWMTDYARGAEYAGRMGWGLDEEGVVATTGLTADLERVDHHGHPEQVRTLRQIIAKLKERRPAALEIRLRSKRSPGPISFFCFELCGVDANGTQLLCCEDVATIVGELRLNQSEAQRAQARDRVRNRIANVRDTLGRRSSDGQE
jgi:hypothetical protein